MAGIPQNFQAVSNVLANYDFVDIASGTGYVNFYLGKTVNSYLLSNFSYYSHNVIYTQSSNAVNGASAKILDLDFDIVLNRPLDLKGQAIVNLPFYMTASAAVFEFTGWTARVRKWDGVTETEVASGATSNYSIGASSTYWMTAIDITIPLTHFKKGETLRLTLEAWGYTTGGGTTGYVRLGHDPKSRTTTWDATGAVVSQCMFQCPVRLNL